MKKYKFETFIFRLKQYISNFILFRQTLGWKKTLFLSYKVIKTKIMQLPMDISVEPTKICNLKCPFCIQAIPMSVVKDKSKAILSFENFKKVIDDIKDFAVQITLYHGGEPLLNKDLYRMMQYATKQGLLTYVNTNGTLLTNPEIRMNLLKSGVYRLHISFDGATAKTYESYRVGAKFEKVKKAIRCLVKERGSAKTPIIAIQMIATKKTLPELEAYREMARDLGVDRAFVTTMFVNQYKRSPSAEELEDLIIGGQYSRYDGFKNGRLIIRKSDSSTCPCQHAVHVLVNGTLLNCSYDFNNENTFGNTFETDFKELWRNPKYVEWRKKFARPMKLALCKQSCTPSVRGGWTELYHRSDLKFPSAYSLVD